MYCSITKIDQRPVKLLRFHPPEKVFQVFKSWFLKFFNVQQVFIFETSGVKALAPADLIGLFHVGQEKGRDHEFCVAFL